MLKKIRKRVKGRRVRLPALKPKRERGIRIKPKRSMVIGVFSCKGGVGKTTTAANIGMYLSEHMKDNILTVDANLSAPNLSLHLGEFNPKVTIHDVLANEVPIELAVIKRHGLPVLLGSIAYGEQIHLVDLRGHLEPLKKKYKLIIIDSAPGIGSEVVAAIKACDKIIVVTDPTMKEMVRKVSPGIFATPAAFIVICAEKDPDASDWDEWTYLADCAVAAQNIMLAAHALGLGSCVAISYARAAVQEILDIPDQVKPELIVTLGYPAEDPSPPPRLPLSQIVFADKYGKEW